MYDLITSRENRRVKDYVKLASSKRFREESGLFVLEGRKLLFEAIESGVDVCEVFAVEEQIKACEAMLHGREIALHQVNGAVEEKMRQSQSPQGIYAVCRMLDKPSGFDTINGDGRYLLLWDLQDPGNVGTILRTADAMGISGVIVSSGCCDLYNLKTIRAAMGALFHVPLFRTDAAVFLRDTADILPSYAAVVDRDAPSILTHPIRRGIVVIGNEGNGLSEEQAACCQNRVTIPMPGRAESLNAATAASLLLWELTKTNLEEL